MQTQLFSAFKCFVILIPLKKQPQNGILLFVFMGETQTRYGGRL